MSNRTDLFNTRDFERVSRAIAYLDAHWREQPTLSQIAKSAHLSEHHFSRLFHQWAGIAPKTYLQHITGSIAKSRLRDRGSLLDTALAVGLSGPGRLHDLIIKLESMTPAQYAAGGAGLQIVCGTAATPFGQMLAGRTERGICYLSFVADITRTRALALLADQWPEAQLHWRPDSAAHLASLLWPAAFGSPGDRAPPVCVHVQGSNFQLKVWQALLELGPGACTSYGELGAKLGLSGAARAIGGAVGANPVAWLIPCHRVLRAGGDLGGYRWGVDRKRAILAWENLRSEAEFRSSCA